MDFGRLDDISEVDFSLPEIDHFYFRNNGNNHLELLLGAPGWSEPKWKGSIYPAKAKPSEFAAYYSRQFATIEFNTTYYQVPKPALMERWYDLTEPDFVFCPKMFAGISQSNSFALGDSILPDFLLRMGKLKEKLGLIYMQLPQSFSFVKLESLKKFIRQWRPGIPLAIEIRHESYFKSQNAPVLAEEMAMANISWMITDVAGRRDASHSYITAPFMAIRFVANNDESDFTRADNWVDRLVVWQTNGVELVYFFLHTKGQPPIVLSEYLAKKWKEKSTHDIKKPTVIDREK